MTPADESGQGAATAPPRRTCRLVKAALLLAVVLLSSLLLSVAALAQQSTSYDLACWSVTTGGGGQRSSGTARMIDVLGQNASGASTSSSFALRAGLVQNLDFLNPTPTPVITPAPRPTGVAIINLPLINSYVAIQRTCPQ